MDEVPFSQVKALLLRVGAKADARMIPRLSREWLNLMGRTVEYAAAAAKSACRTEIEAVHVLAAIREEAFDYAGYRSVSGTGRKQGDAEVLRGPAAAEDAEEAAAAKAAEAVEDAAAAKAAEDSRATEAAEEAAPAEQAAAEAAPAEVGAEAAAADVAGAEAAVEVAANKAAEERGRLKRKRKSRAAAMPAQGEKGGSFVPETPDILPAAPGEPSTPEQLSRPNCMRRGGREAAEEAVEEAAAAKQAAAEGAVAEVAVAAAPAAVAAAAEVTAAEAAAADAAAAAAPPPLQVRLPRWTRPPHLAVQGAGHNFGLGVKDL